MREEVRNIGSYVGENMRLKIYQIVIFMALEVLGILLFILNFGVLGSIGLVIVGISYVLGIFTYRGYKIWRVGYEGEEKVIDILKKIEGYIIKGKKFGDFDIDLIMIRKNGVYVIEVKNYSGEIFCDGDTWKRYKTGGKGKRYEIKIGNPSKGAKKAASIIKEEVNKKLSMRIWIEAVIVFTNPKSKLEIKNPTVNIITLKELENFIKQKQDFMKEDDAKKIFLALSN